MMKYLTELHCHTREVSACANLPAEEVAENYIAAGYTTVVVTNHFLAETLNNAGTTWEEKVDHFFSGYRRMKEYAGNRLNVLPGAEIRFNNLRGTDYLLLGMNEEFLYKHPDLIGMRPHFFAPFVREAGMLLVQAHPFRNDMVISKPEDIDGMEVFNGSSHDSRNDIADQWANRYGLIRTAGSDYHGKGYTPNAGIYTEEPITSAQQLTEILRSGNYTLHCSGENAEREGFADDIPARGLRPQV